MAALTTFTITMAAFYVVPFAILALLPRWRYLIPASLVVLALLCWQWVEIAHADGPGVMMAIPALMLMTTGAFAAFVGRATLIGIKEWGHGRSRQAAVLTIFFFGIPLLLTGVSMLQHRQMEKRQAPPSVACMSKPISARMADVALQIPLAPDISVGQGREYNPAYQFRINEQARTFCALRGNQPVPITNLTIRPDYPAKGEVNLFAIGAFDASRMFGLDNSGPISYRLTHGSRWIRVDEEIDRLGDDANPIYRRTRPSGYIAQCRTVPERTTMQCRASYPLVPGVRGTGGVGIIFDFQTTSNTFKADSGTANVRVMHDVKQRLHPVWTDPQPEMVTGRPSPL